MAISRTGKDAKQPFYHARWQPRGGGGFTAAFDAHFPYLSLVATHILCAWTPMDDRKH